jgi:hypothetical protein
MDFPIVSPAVVHSDHECLVASPKLNPKFNFNVNFADCESGRQLKNYSNPYATLLPFLNGQCPRITTWGLRDHELP